VYSHRLLILFSLLALLLGPELLDLWLFSDGPWYQPFLIWLGLCTLTALIEQGSRREL
jgi:hypothetical protein